MCLAIQVLVWDRRALAFRRGAKRDIQLFAFTSAGPTPPAAPCAPSAPPTTRPTNSSASPTPDSRLTFTYDSGGRPLTAATSGPAGQPTVTLAATYTATGEHLILTDERGHNGTSNFLFQRDASGGTLRTVTLAATYTATGERLTLTDDLAGVGS